MAGKKKNYIALTGLFYESKIVPEGEKVLLSKTQAENLLKLKAVCLPEDYSAKGPEKEVTEQETSDTETISDTETKTDTEPSLNPQTTT